MPKSAHDDADAVYLGLYVPRDLHAWFMEQAKADARTLSSYTRWVLLNHRAEKEQRELEPESAIA